MRGNRTKYFDFPGSGVAKNGDVARTSLVGCYAVAAGGGMAHLASRNRILPVGIDQLTEFSFGSSLNTRFVAKYTLSSLDWRHFALLPTGGFRWEYGNAFGISKDWKKSHKIRGVDLRYSIGTEVT